MMVQTFAGVGVGQWFRYLTGIIEIGSAVLRGVPGRQAIGAGLLVCTMIGAAIIAVPAHLVRSGGSGGSGAGAGHSGRDLALCQPRAVEPGLG